MTEPTFWQVVGSVAGIIAAPFIVIWHRLNRDIKTAKETGEAAIYKSHETRVYLSERFHTKNEVRDIVDRTVIPINGGINDLKEHLHRLESKIDSLCK